MRLKNLKLLAADLMTVIKRDKKWVWVPIFLLLVILGLMFLGLSLAGPTATFIYPFL